MLDIVQAAAITGDDTAPTLSITGTGTSAAIMLDERLVSRAVRNLLANARRHAHQAVHVAVIDTGDGVWVHVDDDGPGVAAADRPAIFRRFGRLDEAPHHDAGRAGLGLAIVASVAPAHGGEVDVGDAELGWARVSIWLPARPRSHVALAESDERLQPQR